MAVGNLPCFVHAVGCKVVSAGHIALAGTPLAHLSVEQRARKIAWVPQQSALAGGTDVRSVVAMGAMPIAVGPFVCGRTTMPLLPMLLNDAPLPVGGTVNWFPVRW